MGNIATPEMIAAAGMREIARMELGPGPRSVGEATEATFERQDKEPGHEHYVIAGHTRSPRKGRTRAL